MPTTVKPSVRWQSTPENDIVWYSCGEQFVAYQRTSGKTHFLNASSFCLISELLRVPSDLQTVVEYFSSSDIHPNELENELSDLLEYFEEHGLIQKL